MDHYTFADGTSFNPATGELTRDGRLRRLEPQPAAILALLASRPGELVTHDDIRRAVWPADVHVDFRQSLHYGIRHVRRALGETARDPAVIETVPRRGYRLLASALAQPRPTAAPPPSAPREATTASTGSPGAVTTSRAATTLSRRRAVRMALVAAALVLLWVADRRPNRHHDVTVALLRTVHDWLY